MNRVFARGPSPVRPARLAGGARGRLRRTGRPRARRRRRPWSCGRQRPRSAGCAPWHPRNNIQRRRCRCANRPAWPGSLQRRTPPRRARQGHRGPRHAACELPAHRPQPAGAPRQPVPRPCRPSRCARGGGARRPACVQRQRLGQERPAPATRSAVFGSTTPCRDFIPARQAPPNPARSTCLTDRRWERKAARRRSCSPQWRPARPATRPSRRRPVPGPSSRAGAWRGSRPSRRTG